MTSKGDWPRPVNQKFDEEFDRIFGKKKEKRNDKDTTR